MKTKQKKNGASATRETNQETLIPGEFKPRISRSPRLGMKGFRGIWAWGGKSWAKPYHPKPSPLSPYTPETLKPKTLQPQTPTAPETPAASALGARLPARQPFFQVLPQGLVRHVDELHGLGHCWA